MDPRLHGSRYALWPAQFGAGSHFLAEVAVSRVVGRNNFFRIFIAQLIQAELAAICDEPCFCNECLGVQRLQRAQRTQVLLAVDQSPVTQLLHWSLESNGG